MDEREAVPGRRESEAEGDATGLMMMSRGSRASVAHWQKKLSNMVPEVSL